MPRANSQATSRAATARRAARTKNASATALTARTADKHAVYESAVQNPEAEVNFVDRVYTRMRGKRASLIREDFCGTAATCCEWVRRRPTNRAIGLDLHAPTLANGRVRHVAKLPEAAQSRVTLLQRNVMTPGADASGVDAVLAMNFSYWIFRERAQLLEYFRIVRSTLAKGGIFFLDHYGGHEAMQIRPERRRCKGFTYIWDQQRLNPITHEYLCRIHFEFRDGTRMNNAFTYHWRLWMLPEVVDLLRDAGFRHVTVYWEGDDGNGGGNGVFRPATRAEPCATYVTYITAHD
ncbi:MAG: class I SAM-dependent methyltransferase [Planctomycetota bacterium]|nr:class I SAM-dependent methyltransferase [Planctomycetota bacterium]